MTGRQMQTARRGGRTETVTIAAGERRQFTGLGNKVNCLSSTADLVLFIDNSGERILFRKGIVFELVPGDDYTGFALVNEGASAVTAKLYYGYHDLRDEQTVISGSLSQPSGLRDTADQNVAIGAKVTVAADTNRRTVVIRNNSTTLYGRVGAPGTVGDARGLILAPETTISLDTAADVAVWNLSTNGAALPVSVLELYEA